MTVTGPFGVMRARMALVQVESVVVGFFLTWCALSFIACMTWFLSSRPRLFLHIFLPAKGVMPDVERRKALRMILRDPNYRSCMRAIALLQFGAAAVMVLIGYLLAAQ
jgi:hypothetical protein